MDLLAPVLPYLAPALLAAALPLLAFALVPSSRLSRSVATRLRSRTGEASARPPRFLAPPGLVTRMERNLQLAGLSGEWSLRSLLLGKALGAGVALALGVALVVAAPGPAAVLLAVVLVAVGYLAPDVVVAARASDRQDRIRRELADTLDQILISIEAGLGLEAAVGRAAAHGRGPLAAELTRTVHDMRVGLSRREAYLALADRTEVADLRRFARAIMQADAYGVSVAGVVRQQARELRTARRQRAEERAMRVPVLVLFPLMFCILPVLFIVVLAPAVINLVAALAGAG